MHPSKKRSDNSNVKFAKTSFTANFPGGGSAAEIMEVVKDLKDSQEKEEKTEGQQDQKTVNAINQQTQMQAQLAQQQNVAQEVEKKELNRQIGKIEEGMPSGVKIILALTIAIIYDTVTGIIEVVTLGASGLGDGFIDLLLMQMIVFPYLLGDYFKMPGWMKLLEIIPWSGILPLYTYSVYNSWKATKGGRHEIGDLQKEKRKLFSGGTGRAGPLGISMRWWVILITIFTMSAVIGFFIFGLFGVMAPAIVFILILFLVALENPDTRHTAFTLLILLVIVAVLGAGLILAASTVLSGYGGPMGKYMGKLAAIPVTFQDYWQNNNPIDAMQAYFKKQVAFATGDFYTGKVDENAKAQLGVYLEDMKQADPTFYTDRPVGIYANLKILTLDEPINVTISCNNSKSKAKPKIYPKDKFNVATYEEREIDCTFPTGTVDKGSSIITMGAEFNFKTMSYVKTYFMEIDRLRSFRREEIDPLEQYGIKEKTPVAIYTNGPVGIGMGVGNPPVGIDFSQDSVMMTLGITIDNKWDGKILGMNRMIVILPKQFTLEEIGVPFTQIDCKQLKKEEKGICEDEINNVYFVRDPKLEIGKGSFKSYRAFLKINKDQYENVLGLTPISTKFFKVTMDYRYKLSKTKTIEVKSRQTKAFDSSIVAGTDVDILAPSISNFKTERQTGGNVKISWKTNEDSNDIFVWWDVAKAGASSNPLTTPGETGFTKEHVRILMDKSIQTGKTYGYKLTTADAKGNTGSTTRTFTI